MKKSSFLFLSILICLSITACNKNKEPETSQALETASSQPSENEQKNKTTKEEVSPQKKSYLQVFNTVELSKDYKTKAHTAYLNTPLIFNKIENKGEENCRYMLVASNEAQFYTPDNFIFVESEENPPEIKRAVLKDPENMQGKPVPIGTIFKKSDVIYSGGTENYEKYDGLFYFQNNYNKFYKVNWNDQEGYIFGADLSEELWETDYSTEAIASVLYKNQGKLNDFYAYEGLKPLSDKVVVCLETDRLAIQKTAPKSWLSIDDLIDSYKEISKTTPIFITTDLFSHVQHLFFDKLLQETEEDYFAPCLFNICQNFIKAISDRQDIPHEIKEKAVAYFQVPELILRSAPKKVKDEDSWRNEYI